MKSNFLLLAFLVFASEYMAGISITTKSVPNGTVNKSYSAVIIAQGGCTPFKWQVVSGSLPTGISMKVSKNTTSVTLSDTPTKAATYTFTISATGCGGGVSKKWYKIVIQSNSGHVVDLNWNASTSSDVAGYNVYRSLDDKSWTKINASLTAWTTYTDSTVANSTTYYYAATAVDIYGNESAMSNIAKTSIP